MSFILAGARRRRASGGGGGVSPAAYTFGQYTVPGDATLPISAPDGTYGPLVVSGGILDVSTSNSTPGFYLVGANTVNVVADRRSIRTTAQLGAMLTGLTPAYGGVLLRPGSYGIGAWIAANSNWNNRFLNLRDGFVFESDTLTNKAVLDNVELSGATALGTIQFKNVNFYLPQPLTKYDPFNIYNDADVHMIDANNAVDLVVEDCAFASDLKSPHEPGGIEAGIGGRLWCSMQGVNVNSTVRSLRVRRCTFDRVAIGISSACRDTILEDYEVSRFWQDPVVWVNPAGGIIRNFHHREPIGWNLIFHPDVGMQFQPDNGTNEPYSPVQIYGFSIALGDIANNTFTGPEATDRSSITVTAPVTFTVAEHNGQEIRFNQSVGTVTYPLPDASTSGPMSLVFRNPYGTTSGVFQTFSLASGNTYQSLDGANVIPTLAGQSGWGIETYGDGIWRERRRGDWRPWMVHRRSNFQLGIAEHERTVAAEAVTGPITITGAADTTAQDTKIVKADITSNHVTFNAPAGQTISYYGETLTSIAIAHPGLSVELLRAAGSTVWVATQKGYSAQILFGNDVLGATPNLVGGYGILGSSIRDGVAQGVSTNGLRFEESVMTNWLYQNITFVPVIEPDDRVPGFVSKYRAIGDSLSSACNMYVYNGATMALCSTVGKISTDFSGSPTTGDVWDSSDLNTFIPASLPAWLARHKGYPAGQHPVTRAQIVDAGRNVPGSTEALEWRGAVGPTDSTGSYNFVTNTRNTGGPAPRVVRLLPVNNAELVATSTPIVMSFNQAMQAGTGNIVLWNAETNSLIENISVTNTARVKFIANRVEVTPTAALPDLTIVEVRYASGVLIGSFGTSAPAVAATEWKFYVGKIAAVSGITLVGFRQITHSGAVTSMTLDGLTGGIASVAAEGDFVVLFRAVGSLVNRTLAVTTSGYAQTALNVGSGTNRRACTVTGSKIIGAGETSVAWSGAGTSTEVNTATIIVFRGVNAATPLDVATVTTPLPGVSAPNPGPITPVTTGAKVLFLSATGYDTSAGALALSSGDMTQIAAWSALSTGTAAISGHAGIVDWTSGVVNPGAYTFGRSDAVDNAVSIALALRPA